MITAEHSLDTRMRRAVIEQFMLNLWLHTKARRALYAWMDLEFGDPKVARIERAITAASITVREYKLNHRNTMFARAMRLRDRRRHGAPRYKGEAVISAAHMRMIAERTDWIKITEDTHPVTGKGLRLGHNRRVDMMTCLKFLNDVESKLIQTTVWPDELMTIRSFARLGLTPDELLRAETALNRLIAQLKRAGYQPLYRMPSYGHRSRRHVTITLGDFLDIMNKMDDQAPTIDQQRLFALAKLLQMHLAYVTVSNT